MTREGGIQLGELIRRLEAVSRDRRDRILVYSFGSAGSYRGYYECVAFDPVAGGTVANMLECARSALGTAFTGYKGGEFRMGEDTECFVAHYGDVGIPLKPGLLRLMLSQVSDDGEEL